MCRCQFRQLGVRIPSPMQSRDYKLIAISILILIIIASPCVIFLPGGSIVASAVPRLPEFINKISTRFGYELECFDVHGDFRCIFVKPLMGRSQGTLTGNLQNAGFGCESDDDCFTTKKGGCVTGKSFANIMAAQIVDKHAAGFRCICQKGPVIFGCCREGTGCM